MKALFDAIYTRFSTTNTFNTSVGGRMYFMEAPQGATFPYAVYFPVSATTDWTFNDTIDFEEYLIQFSIFSRDESAIEIANCYEYLKDLYDFCVLSVTGYTHIHMHRELAIMTRDPDEKIWKYNVDYNVLLEEN